MGKQTRKYFDVKIGQHVAGGSPIALSTAYCQQKLQSLGDDKLLCLCVPHSAPRLVVRLQNNRYFPARWPNTNLLHHPNCHYYSSYQARNSGAKTKPSVVEREDGSIRVHLLTSLKIATQSSKEVTISKRKSEDGSGVRQERAKDRFLFNLLWEQAGLTSFSGAKADKLNWFIISQRLMHAAEQLIITKDDEKLSDYLLIAGPDTSRNLQAHNAKVLSLPERRYFLTGVMRTALVPSEAQKENTLLPLLHPFPDLKFSVNRKRFNKYARRWPLLENIKNTGGHVLIFACVTPRKKFANSSERWFDVTQICLVPVSKHYIPVESSYEAEFAEYLIDHGRDFGKPVASQNAGTVRPDFVLYDTNPVTFVEVWGMNTAEYAARMEEKITYYLNKRLNLLDWHAYSGVAKPKLPPIARKKM